MRLETEPTCEEASVKPFSQGGEPHLHSLDTEVPRPRPSPQHPHLVAPGSVCGVLYGTPGVSTRLWGPEPRDPPPAAASELKMVFQD